MCIVWEMRARKETPGPLSEEEEEEEDIVNERTALL